MGYKYLLDDFGDGPADFETAIDATGIGKFNLVMLLIAIPSGWASVFDTKTMSYVAPVAQCDLELTLEDKGLLNAITYIGILSSGFIWGFLADTYGRKKLLILCYLLDTVFIFLAGISQTFTMLLITKYLAGFVMNGPNAILISLLSEFHSKKRRARFFLLQGLFSNFANIILPMMAWVIFQDYMQLEVYDGLKLNSWNIYILLSALPSLISGLANMALPESPKFLMSVGKNDKAMEVFKKVYSWNTGKHPDTYPIKSLADETIDPNCGNNNGSPSKKPKKESWSAKLKSMLDLFCPPYIFIIVFLSAVQMGYKMGLNSLKNWVPQLFTAMNDYHTVHNTSSVHFCDVLETMTHVHRNISTHCTVNFDHNNVYTNLIIVQSASVVSFLLTAWVINRIGKRNLFIIYGALSGLSGGAIYFAQDVTTVVALTTILTAISAVNTVVLNVSVTELLPTRLCTMAISFTRLTGLAETIIGNIIFPHLLKAGCAPPFIFVSVISIGCSFLALFLPKEKADHH